MLHRRLSQAARGLAAAAAATLSGAQAVPAWAQESPQRQVMIGAGAQLKPAYPGADHSKVSFLPDLTVWRTGEAIPVETPDEGKGFSIIGDSGGTAFGPALTFAPRRSATAVPGLPAIGFGVELGVFAETYVAGPVRLRAELRHGIGAHQALTADLAADLVLRRGNEGLLATIGPRLRWGSAKYNRAYFGIAAPGPSPALPAYQPGCGIYAVGAVAGIHLPVGRRLGLFSYAGYDRLSDAAARSPIVKTGSQDQFSAGLAMTYRFSI